jgi:photosystem II stability/assembly factor-like uncharacterized protein
VAAESLIWRSDDAGKTWQEFAMRTRDRPSGLPIDLQVDPRDPYRIFVNNYGGGNFLSEDGGESWVEASQGYTGSKVNDVIVDPQDPAKVMARNFSSQDGGQNWKPAEIPEFETYALWPEASADKTRVIAASVDVWAGYIGSSDWLSMQLVDLDTELAAGRIEDERMLIAALASSPTADQVLYAGFAHGNCSQGVWERCLGVATPGFFRSVDGGSHWERLENVPWHPYATLSIDLDPQKDGILYVGTAVGLYFSQDGGESWEHLRDLDRVTNQVPVVDWSVIPTGLEASIVRDVRIDPFNTNTLYAAATPGGVYRSDDGGKTWMQVAAGMDPNEPVYVLLPDPFRPSVLYTSSAVSGVFVSTNRGESWSLMSDGLLVRNIRGLSITGDGRHLYAGSIGGGVFRMDFFGDPPFVPPPAIEEPTSQPENTEPAGEATALLTPTPQDVKARLKLPCLGGTLPLVVIGLALLKRPSRAE